MSEAISKEKVKLQIIKTLHIISAFMLIVLGVSISIDTFSNISYLTGDTYMKIQLWICIYFLLSLFIEFILSKKKSKFFWNNIIFILISIPYLNLFEAFDISFSSEMKYFFRFIPLIRGGYALGFVIIMLSRKKISGLFFSYILILMSLIYFYSLIFYVFEHEINPDVNSYFDALWWAAMGATTTGSNIIAITPVGKILSVITAISGITMFPFFTVYVTSLVQRKVAFQGKKVKSKIK
ncbi:ion channel [Myroides sp. TSA_177.3]|uniref:ion channel n=1 Tax=Myroides sp. TSA_177.3 TaxID=3415650 RepID=UPI0040462891